MPRKPAVPSRSCGACAHCSPNPPPAENEAPTDGHCRRFPPSALVKVTGDLLATFPAVRLADFWCGEFKTRGKA